MAESIRSGKFNRYSAEEVACQKKPVEKSKKEISDFGSEQRMMKKFVRQSADVLFVVRRIDGATLLCPF